VVKPGPGFGQAEVRMVPCPFCTIDDARAMSV
jgi:hypothetical protein